MTRRARRPKPDAAAPPPAPRPEPDAGEAAALAPDGDVVPVVAFRVGPIECAADVFAVRRIVPYEPPAPDRGGRPAPYREGSVRVGEEAVPVLDLRKRFSLADAAVGPETRIVIVEGASGPVGLVVDAARDVLRVASGAIAPPSAAVHGLDARYVQGIIRLPGRSLVLLRTARLLASTERIVLEPAREEEHG